MTPSNAPIRPEDACVGPLEFRAHGLGNLRLGGLQAMPLLLVSGEVVQAAAAAAVERRRAAGLGRRVREARPAPARVRHIPKQQLEERAVLRFEERGLRDLQGASRRRGHLTNEPGPEVLRVRRRQRCVRRRSRGYSDEGGRDVGEVRQAEQPLAGCPPAAALEESAANECRQPDAAFEVRQLGASQWKVVGAERASGKRWAAVVRAEPYQRVVVEAVLLQ